MSPLAVRLLSVACDTAYVATSAGVAAGAGAASLVVSAGCACGLTALLLPEVLS